MKEPTLNERLLALQQDPKIKDAVAHGKRVTLLKTADELKICAVVVRQLINERTEAQDTAKYIDKLIAKAEQLKRKL